MAVEHILTKDAPAPLPINPSANNQYSQAVRAGNYVYTSGSVGMTKEGQMVEGTVQDRTRQIIQNLEAVLKGANMTLKNVVKANIYLSDLAKDFNTMNEVYKELMPDPKPARTCVGVAQLPAGGTDVEIEFVAYDDDESLMQQVMIDADVRPLHGPKPVASAYAARSEMPPAHASTPIK